MALVALVFGIVVAANALATSKRILNRLPTLRMKRNLIPRTGTVTPKRLKTIERAMSSWVNRYTLLGLLPIGISAVGLGIASPFFGELGVAALLGLAGFLVLGYAFLLHFPLTEHRKRLSFMASRQLVRHTRPEISEEILTRVAESSSPMTRLAAVEGLRELGTATGNELLRQLSEDKNDPVAAAARDALSNLLPVLKGGQTLSVRTMETYVREHEFWEKKVRSQSWLDNPGPSDQLAEITRQIDDIVFSQLPIRRAYPYVYCMDCYSRAEEMRHNEWEWIRCKQCKEVHGLKIGVRKVVGQIGGESTSHFEEGTLYLPLWDEGSHQARYAELDELQVIGGKEINYDWAVGALLQKIHDHHQGPAYTTGVRLIGQPRLEMNSLQLLRSLDPSATSLEQENSGG
ncbi:MAG: HEAT repeat domain-containing protein [Bacteroidia bacterium]